MGRTTSAENKGKFITIRVKASLKNELLRVHEEFFGNITFQDFLATILFSGLEYEVILQKKRKEWQKDLVVVKSQKEPEKLGGDADQTIQEYASPKQSDRFREVENPPLQKIAQRREKKRG